MTAAQLSLFAPPAVQPQEEQDLVTERHHQTAPRRTPSSKHPQEVVFVMGVHQSGFAWSVADALASEVDAYHEAHGCLPPAGWMPNVCIFATIPIPCLVTLASLARTALVSPCDPPMTAQQHTEELERFIQSKTFPEWSIEEERAELVAALVPGMEYLHKHKNKSKKAKLEQLFKPAFDLISAWDFGYELDASHAIDIEPDHMAQILRDWTPQQEPKP
jgi:hypothetical protein